MSALFVFGIIWFVPAAGVASPVASTVSKAEIGIAAMRFKYTEFADSGRVLDSERGNIYGASLKLGLRLSAWEWEGFGSLLRGQVPYNGQSNYGTPYNTRTNEKINDWSLRAGYWFATPYPLAPYVGIGYRQWDRDIQPASLAGLFESYRWRYSWLGAKVSVAQADNASFLLDVGLLKPLRPELLFGADGATTLHPEAKTGLRAILTWQRKLDGNYHLVVEPWYEYWGLGRSPTVFSGAYSIYEPESKTSNIGVNLRLGWSL